MNLETTRFGNVEIDDDRVITFPSGLLGFSSYDSFVLLQPDEQGVFFWLQSGDQLDLERKLNLGFGYPAVVAIAPNKQVFATMRGSFSYDNVNEFLTKVLTGSAPVDKLPPTGIEIRKADKWDGKDAQPIVEDEL